MVVVEHRVFWIWYIKRLMTRLTNERSTCSMNPTGKNKTKWPFNSYTGIFSCDIEVHWHCVMMLLYLIYGLYRLLLQSIVLCYVHINVGAVGTLDNRRPNQQSEKRRKHNISQPVSNYSNTPLFVKLHIQKVLYNVQWIASNDLHNNFVIIYYSHL